MAVVRTQVYLTEEQERGLKRLSAATGRKQSELIREALDRYLGANEPKDWKAAFESVRGMWADRDDLDDFVSDLRTGWERRRKRIDRR